MSKIIRITTLVENTVNRGGFLAQHGLSFHIQAEERQILFDTGQTAEVLLHNARKMGSELDHLDAIVLSHGHYDHTGSLSAILREASRARLYLHPAAMQPKFSKDHNGLSRSIGMPENAIKAIQERTGLVYWTPHSTEISEGIFVTGDIPRENDFEDVGGPFFLDPEGTKPDPISDDQAFYFDTQEGVVVVLGCAHSGVINTLNYVTKLTGGRPIHAIIGGLHLLAADQRRMCRTLDSLEAFNIPKMAVAHCTGMAAMAQLWNKFPGRCMSCSIGVNLEFRL